MVNLPLGYRLEGDGVCLTLVKPLGTFSTDKTTGKTTENKRYVGYYSTIPQALDGWWRAACRELVAQPGEMELKELLSQIKALSGEAVRAIGNTSLTELSRGPVAPPEAAKKKRTTKAKGADESGL